MSECHEDRRGKWDLTAPAGLVAVVACCGRKVPAVRRLQAVVEAEQANFDEPFTRDSRNRKNPFDRLAQGIVIGSSGCHEQELLYLDPQDGFAVDTEERVEQEPADKSKSFERG